MIISLSLKKYLLFAELASHTPKILTLLIFNINLFSSCFIFSNWPHCFDIPCPEKYFYFMRTVAGWRFSDIFPSWRSLPSRNKFQAVWFPLRHFVNSQWMSIKWQCPYLTTEELIPVDLKPIHVVINYNLILKIQDFFMGLMLMWFFVAFITVFYWGAISS